MDRQKQLKQQLLRQTRTNLRRNYTLLFVVTIVVFCILVAISVAMKTFNIQNFIVDVINNMIGILPPILLFDFFYNKLSENSSSIEMSSRITQTLIGNPEAMDLFTSDQKRSFIRSAIQSEVKDDDVVEMIEYNLHNYLNAHMFYRIRTEFNYNFELSTYLPQVYQDLGLREEDYFRVQEVLSYEVKYLQNADKKEDKKESEEDINNTKSDLIKIGFAFDNKILDSALRESTQDDIFKGCIFRENLDIRREDLENIRSHAMNPDQNKVNKFFLDFFGIDLQIDAANGVLDHVDCNGKGIICCFNVGHDREVTTHSVRIIFHMPRLWNTILEVALVDPTKAPKISFSYSEDHMDVEMYPFLSKGDESSLETTHEHRNGIYDIAIHSE